MTPRSLVLAGALLSFGLAGTARPQAAAAAPAATGSAVIRPPDSLVADGIPEIPTGIAEAVGRYTEFRSAFLTSWHPVKREMPGCSARTR